MGRNILIMKRAFKKYFVKVWENGSVSKVHGTLMGRSEFNP